MNRFLTGLVVLSPVLLLAAEPPTDVLPGDERCTAAPERPVGWLGDWHGRYYGAHDFPLEWEAPKEWSEPAEAGKNILWKTALPGWGHSSPVFVNGRIFLTCEHDMTVGLDAATGKVLWKHSAGAKHSGSSGTYHYSTGWTFGTVCSDGKSVFANHFNGVVISYDFDGNVRWRKDVPPLGWCAASPVIIGDTVVVIHNALKKGETPAAQKPNIRGPYEIAAYKCSDGEKVWGNTGTLLMNGWHHNGLAPIRVGDRVFLVTYCGQIYDARDGKLLMQLTHAGGWGCQWLAAVDGTTVVLSYEMGDPSGWRRKMIDLKVDDVPEPAGMEWLTAHAKEANPKKPAKRQLILPVRLSLGEDGALKAAVRGRPTVLARGGGYNHALLDGDILYYVFDGPVIAIVDLKTGEAVGPDGYEGWQPTGEEKGGWFFSHAVVAGDYFMVSHWGGLTRVFRRAPDFRLLASNQTTWAATRKSAGVIGNPMNSVESSPFFHGDRIYFRHWDALYCIGDRNKSERETAFAAAREHAENGRTKEALDAYRALWQSEILHVRYRALKEMGSVLGANAIDGLCGALRHQDAALRSLAASLAANIPGDTAASRFSAQLKDSDPNYRQEILAVLGRRGNRNVSEALVAALDDRVPQVRLAAVEAAGRIGGAVLVNAMVSRHEQFGAAERAAVMEALVAMPEPGTGDSIAGTIARAKPPVRSVLLRVLGRRGAAAHVGLFLEEAGHTDKAVRIAALDALRAVAGVQHLDAIVERLKAAKDDEERGVAGAALLGIMNRTQSQESYEAALLRGLEGASGGAAASLVRGLGPAGGGKSLTRVRAALKSSDPAMRTAAAESLANWPDTQAEADLLKVAGESKNATDLRFAVRGLLRMIDLSPDRPIEKIISIYERALETGQETETAIRHLAERPDVRAIGLAARYLFRSELEPAIIDTIVLVVPQAAEKDPARTVLALQKALEEVKNAEQRKRIDEVLKAVVSKHGSKAVPMPDEDDLDLDL